MDTSDPIYCGEERLLTMENAEKYFKLKDNLRKLVDKWEDDVYDYPDTEQGKYAAAAVRACGKEVKELLKGGE